MNSFAHGTGSDAEETAGIDRLIGAFFATFDNRSTHPQLARVLACFAPGAVIARCVGEAVEVMDADAFAAPRIALLTGGALTGFHEAETAASTMVLRGLAMRTSRYRKTGLLDGAVFGGTGTKWFHLACIEGAWRITSLAWADDET